MGGQQCQTAANIQKVFEKLQLLHARLSHTSWMLAAVSWSVIGNQETIESKLFQTTAADRSTLFICRLHVP